MYKKVKNRPCIFCSSSIRNLRYLSPCSVIANIFEFVGLAVIAYYIFGTPLPRFDNGDNDDDVDVYDDGDDDDDDDDALSL